MKKLTFALACASTVAAFAVTDGSTPALNAVDFELYTTVPFSGLSLKSDAGASGAATDSYWLYSGAAGADDGSTVKAYGGENLPAQTGGGNNYLELSTEGGTLWRSINNLASATELGTAQEVGESGLFIDTMVQFTPTEDGGVPELGDDDKLAIWLNVDSTGEKPVTNLCVYGRQAYMDGEDFKQEKTTFVLTKADGTDLTVDAGTWYQLTVKAMTIANADGFGRIAGFQISLGNVPLKATTYPFNRDFAAQLAQNNLLSAEAKALIDNGELIPSLEGMQDADTVVTLSAVGFKGSGAIDNFSISEQAIKPAPQGGPAVMEGTDDVTQDADKVTIDTTAKTIVVAAAAADKAVVISGADGYTVTVPNTVASVKATGATIKVKSGDADITAYVAIDTETGALSLDEDAEGITPAISDISIDADGNVTVDTSAIPGLTYTLYKADSLTGDWTVVTDSKGVADAATETKTDTASDSAKFYKVKVSLK